MRPAMSCHSTWMPTVRSDFDTLESASSRWSGMTTLAMFGSGSNQAVEQIDISFAKTPFPTNSAKGKVGRLRLLHPDESVKEGRLP